jgi:alpha-mannosidase
VELDDRGLLCSITDKVARREVLAPGTRGNLLQLHPDYPNFFDAWDIDAWYRRHVEEVTGVESIEVVESGPVRAAIRVARRFGASSIVQTISLTAGSAALDVDNEVDWHEQNRLLKVAFPVSVRSPRATYEIQYGHVERPTHANTSWEAARFEVCAHKWADYSEPGYGVALLNDCKYGYDIRDDVMRLSLLRSPNWPDPEADRGIHRFRYQLLPHAGDLRPAGVINAGYDLNVPLRAVSATPHPGRRPPTGSFLSVDTGHAVIEVVKPADGQPDGLVVRLYEAWGGRGPVTVTAPWPVRRATRTDLLERELAPVESEGDRIHLDLRPFEIVTVKLER